MSLLLVDGDGHEPDQAERRKMKVTREQVAKNRERILEAAGKLFREKGFEGAGVADIMKRAGLTHGGFYGHFASKGDLAAQACAAALADSLKSAVGGAGSEAPNQLEAFAAAYLSSRHRDDLSGGCVLPALGAEAARQHGEVRHTFTEGIDRSWRCWQRLPPALAMRHGAKRPWRRWRDWSGRWSWHEPLTIRRYRMKS